MAEILASKPYSPSSSPRNKGYLSNLFEAFGERLTTTPGNNGDKNPVTFQVNSVKSPMSPKPQALYPLPPKPSGPITGPTIMTTDTNSAQIGPYRIKKDLGEGTFGQVKLGQHVETGQFVAIKLMHKASAKTAKQKVSVQREVRLMKLLAHPHIVGVIDVFETSDLYIVIMEHASGGELFEYIQNRGHVKDKEARKFFNQLISAMDYCHENSVLHRDLKPENLLLDKDKNIKIIDFGFGNTFHADRFLETFCGSPFYAAPEMISGKPYHGPEVDVWSMGVILFALLAGRVPFEAKTMPELYAKIKKGEYENSQYFSTSARHLLKGMLTVNPKERLTLRQVKQHPWVLEDLSVAVKFAPISTRISPVVSVHPETLAELVTYGFSESDCHKTLTSEKKKHPVVSLYYLIDDARLRRERRWEAECARIERHNGHILRQSRSPSPVNRDSPNVTIYGAAFRPMQENSGSSADLSNGGSPTPDNRTILQYLMSRRSPVKGMVN